MKRYNERALTGAVLLLGLSGLIGGCSKTEDVAVTPPTDSSIQSNAGQAGLTGTVKTALLADADLKSLDIKVAVRDGEVRLSGSVDNQRQLDRATEVVRGVAGVSSVFSDVNVKTMTTARADNVADADVTTNVKTALLNDAQTKGFDIGVVTRKGDVLLSGSLDSQAQIDQAMKVARAVDGVHTLHDELIIKK